MRVQAEESRWDGAWAPRFRMAGSRRRKRWERRRLWRTRGCALGGAVRTCVIYNALPTRRAPPQALWIPRTQPAAQRWGRHRARSLSNCATSTCAGLGVGAAATRGTRHGSALPERNAPSSYPERRLSSRAPAAPPPTPQFLAPEKLRGCGALLLDASGRRFVDELATRDVVAAAITAQPGRGAWLLLGSEGAALFGEATLGFYCSKGLVSKVGRRASGARAG